MVVPNPTMHPKYGKIIRRRTVLNIHDELDESRRGDMVEVMPCRPGQQDQDLEARPHRPRPLTKFEAVEAPVVEAKS